MDPVEIIIKKRDGNILDREEIEFFISNFYKKNIPDYQMSAWLMASFLKGLSKEETVHLIEAILSTGDRIEWDFPVIDKHSTGGVGDKLSLVVVPLLASIGFKVAKLSGRGLGHTGGTIDKLESIPGFKTNLPVEEFKRLVEKIGCSIISQTEGLVPVEKDIYSLRDVTGTIESIPLITSSILSKKIAGGAKTILFDVKAGTGAFMKTVAEAETLAHWLKEIGEAFGKEIKIIISDMNEPLGYAIGNLLEVMEAIDTLKGNGPKDLETLAIEICKMIEDEGIVKKAISTGEAFRKFEEMVEAQGGNLNEISLKSRRYSFNSQVNGYVEKLDALSFGEGARLLGAGRLKKEDQIDINVGFLLKKKVGDYVEKGETILEVYYNDEKRLNSCIPFVERAISISNDKVEKLPLVYSIYS
jgi:pyrimidine-nucleoside phosphorylase